MKIIISFCVLIADDVCACSGLCQCVHSVGKAHTVWNAGGGG